MIKIFRKNNKNLFSPLSNKKAFTLVELMVATSLFLVIMISALGSLLMLINESKNSRALRISMENVNFAMESMTRSIRMGSGYYCGNISNLSDIDAYPFGCPNGDDVMSFVPQLDPNNPTTSRIEYRFEDNTVKRYDGTNSATGVSIMSEDVKVSKLEFFVDVADVQPRVYIIMNGTVKVEGAPVSFELQTLASQRNF